MPDRRDPDIGVEDDPLTAIIRGEGRPAGRWIASELGAVNLDHLVQLGVEMGARSSFYCVIGWSSTGDRFAVREGFATRHSALAWILENAILQADNDG